MTLIRTSLYGLVLTRKIGDFRVYGRVKIIKPKNFYFLKGLRINDGCYINASGGVRVGRNVTLSAGSMLLSSGIDIEMFKRPSRKEDYHTHDHITLGDNIWIGAGAIILPGISLSGSNIIVAAGSVVTKSFIENDIVVGGNPAKIIKKI